MSALSLIRRRRRRSAGALAIALMIGAYALLPAAPVNADDPRDNGTADLTRLVLESDDPYGVAGERAVDLLEHTGTTELAADNAAMEPEELVAELRDDPAMFVTGGAMVGYADEAEAGHLDTSQRVASSPPPLDNCDDAYALSSLPDAEKVLYLDFNGHTTIDPDWQNGIRIDSDAYAWEGAICRIWRQVAEDFLPFNVNVTTVEPAAGDLQKTAEDDRRYGQRVVISPTNWTGNDDILGLALMNVFGGAEDHPAFVFTSTLSPANVAEAVSHEAGHTLRLRHDGTVTEAYYLGHGPWASLMGSPISRQVTQWSRGEYQGASDPQDEVAVIAGRTGYRSDDHANLAPSATLVAPSSTTSGVIGAGGDVDVFAVDVQAGLLAVDVQPALSSGSNLLAKVVVRDSAGTAVAMSPSPISLPSAWSAGVTASVATGRYTVEVRAIGYRNPLDSGFSTYGSMGAYQLSLAATPGAVDPSLAVTSRLTPVKPDRLLDTRTGFGGSRRVAAGQQITLQVSGRAGVPAGATAAVLSVVAVDPSLGGFITVFPCSASRPTTSTLNYVRGRTVANTAIATLSPDGQVCLYVQTGTDIVVDVTAWLGTGGDSRFTPVGPDRVMDTRTGLGGATRLPTGGTVQVDLSWLPTDTTAVSLNITAVSGTTAGFVTAYPCNGGRPSTSTINHRAGEIRSNNTIVGSGAGRVCVYSLSAIDVIVDLTGYFATAGLNYIPAAPGRILDTRTTVGYVPPGGAVSFRGTDGSIGARAVSVNITATDHAVAGFVANYDCFTRRLTSTVNPNAGEVNANGAIAPLGNGLDSCLYTHGGGNLVVDLGGWWVP